MSQAVVRDGTAEEAAKVAPWFAGPETVGLAPAAVVEWFRARLADGASLRILTEGTEILAAAWSRRVVADAGGQRVDALLIQGGAPESKLRNASVPILLRGLLKQASGAAVACVTSGGEAKGLGPLGFRAWPGATVTVPARALPRIPAGARVRPAAPVDLAGLVAARDGDARALRIARTAEDWRALLDRWRALRAAGARAPEAHAILRDADRLGYVCVHAEGDTLRVLEAARRPDARKALLGAAGALARGRRLAKVVMPAACLEGVAGAPAPAPVAEPSFGCSLDEALDLAACESGGDPLSGVDRL